MFKNNKILGLVTARSGSKGLTNKNILQFVDKPLINWTIEASQKSKYIDETVVSTDSEEIKKISQIAGASVPFTRPNDLAQDDSTTKDVIVHALSYYKDHEYLVLLQPTSPLRTAMHIDLALEKYFKLQQSLKDTLISVVKLPPKIGWLLKKTQNKKLKCCFNNIEKQRQKLPDFYLPNGAIYIASTKQCLIAKNIWENPFFFEMPKECSIDIDFKEDFDLALKIYTTKSNLFSL